MVNELFFINSLLWQNQFKLANWSGSGKAATLYSVGRQQIFQIDVQFLKKDKKYIRYVNMIVLHFIT